VPFYLIDGCHCPSKMLVPIYKISWGHIPEDNIIVKIPDFLKHLHIYLLFYFDYSSVPTHRLSYRANRNYVPVPFLLSGTIENL
jgi:hypothetical protein